MSFVNKLFVKFFAKEVGLDQFGNKYFVGKSANYLGIKKRFVIYNGINESSKVPPMWHSWLHYSRDDIPREIDNKNYDWQQDYVPNLTGTKYAYDPGESNSEKLLTYTKWTPK